MAKLGRWIKTLSARPPWPLKTFNNPHLEKISASQLVEEEQFSDYVATHYYPVRIGELLDSRYQVVGKLGFGSTSTVWLARDLPGRCHVALKVFVHSASFGGEVSREIAAYGRLAQGPASNPGRSAVRSLLDSFTISGPHGEHQCVVHSPLWDNLTTFLERNPIGRLPAPMLAWTLRRLFQALEYARECKVIHTDIKADNIMLGAQDNFIFEQFEQAELEHPSPRKEVDGRMIYMSRGLEMPQFPGLPVLCDFGAAAWGEERHETAVQPDVYRSPEVILGVPWSYEVDVWNVGCLIWDLIEGRHLFHGTDPDQGVYRSRAHLAEIVALLGPPPSDFVSRGLHSSKFFSEGGEFQAGVDVPPPTPLEDLVTSFEGPEKKLFLQLVRKMLQWDPKDRQTWAQLLEDEWLMSYMPRR